MEVAADRVVDEALLLLGLVSGLVSEHHVVVPSPLDLWYGKNISHTVTSSYANLNSFSQ